MTEVGRLRAFVAGVLACTIVAAACDDADVPRTATRPSAPMVPVDPDAADRPNAPPPASTIAVDRAAGVTYAELFAEPQPPAAPGGRGPSSTGSEADPQALAALIDLTALQISVHWSEAFARLGTFWFPPAYYVIPAGLKWPTSCRDGTGKAREAGDPNEEAGLVPVFYCSGDHAVYLSGKWLFERVWSPLLAEAGGARTVGDFVVAALIAHEYGHAVQTVVGVELPSDASSVEPLELQADCLAGVWANGEYFQNMLSDADIAAAVEWLDAAGTYELGPSQQGTPAERVAAFRLGYETGDGLRCTLDLGDGGAGSGATTSTTGGGGSGPGDLTIPVSWRDVLIGWWHYPLPAPNSGSETYTIKADGTGGEAFWPGGFGESDVVGSGETPLVWRIDGSELHLRIGASREDQWTLLAYDAGDDLLYLANFDDGAVVWVGCASSHYPVELPDPRCSQG